MTGATQILENYLLQCPVTTLSSLSAKSNQNWEIFGLKQPVQEKNQVWSFAISKKDIIKYSSEVIPSLFCYYVFCSNSNFSYKQRFLNADLLIAASHFKNCFPRPFVEAKDHTL